MYATGQSGASFWESHDGGRSWKVDPSAPGVLTKLWLSPVDGAVYGTVLAAAAGEQSPANGPQGMPWKRARATGVVSGTPILETALRPVCTGADSSRAVTPGSTFPVGDTTITCTARDTFGKTSTRALTISVRDTTGPTITVPATTPSASAPPGQPAVVTFAVTAADAVDPSPTVSCTPASGSSFPHGTTLVRCTAADHATPQNVTTTVFPVVVADAPFALPVVTTPGDQTVEAQGPNGATATFAVTAASASGSPLAATCQPSGTSFPIGVTTVTCTASDSGGTGAASFRVTVRDTQGPTVNVPTDRTVAATSTSGAIVTFAASANDIVDGAVTPTCAPASGALFPLGVTRVGCSATDRSGHQGNAYFTITVAALNPPVLHLADITVEAQDMLGARVAYGPAVSATDLEDGAVPVICLPPSGSWFPAGVPTTVPCSATDSNGHETRGTFQVRVVDTTPPAVTLSAPVVVEATGSSGAPVTFAAAGLDLVDGVVATACTRPSATGSVAVTSGATLPLGANPITCAAIDRAGNAGTATATVLVRDTTPPALTVPASLNAQADATGTAVVTFTATATDVVSGALGVGCTPASGSRFPPGTTTVTCSARDSSGNGTTKTFTVTVADTVPPAITVPPDITISVCTNAAIGTASATDLVGPVTITSNKPATFPLGTTTVTWTARDGAGNVATGTQRVTAVLGDDASCCPAGTNIIKGTAGADVINAGNSSNCILGLGGNDVINSGNAADYISGGAGNDTINAGNGNDVITGGDGNDVINGGSGDDQISGDAGNDVIDGAAGNDVINGGAGTDVCAGGTGTNTFAGCETKS
jgi:hypothetical protein